MDQRPVLTVSLMVARAIHAVVVAAITVAVAAGIARDPGALWRPMIIGVGVFFPLGVVGSLLGLRIMRRLDPEPLPRGWIPRYSITDGMLAEMRHPANWVVISLIALCLVFVDPIAAVYLASIGLGIAPAWAFMAVATRSWERRHATQLVGPTRSSGTPRKTIYYGIAMPEDAADSA
ncbi:MAG: hypothetical protein Q8K79_04935 [Solirubrobacteraceae bacterium]|nr:hypothetical protein [Solirubrobacteraceae bacterium]